MSKNIENTMIRKLPTSQLIFYMTNPEFKYLNKKSKIEATLYARLTGSYKLELDGARKFISREQDIIGVRGYDIEKYTFGADKNCQDSFRVFYDNIASHSMRGYTLDKKTPYDILFKIFNEYEHFEKMYEDYVSSGSRGIMPTLRTEDKFNTLTMSEIVDFMALFGVYSSCFKNRLKKLHKEYLKINNNGQESTPISNIGIDSFASIVMQINELNKVREIIQLQYDNECDLIKYHKMLYDFMYSKLEEVMGYRHIQYGRKYMTYKREVRLLNNKSSIRKAEELKHKDLDFDAFTYHTVVPNDYIAKGFSK